MDRTLIAGNSGVSFMRYSLSRGKTNHWMVWRAMLDYIRYRFDLLNMSKAYRKTLKPLIGIREEELIDFCQEWFEEVLKKLIYPEAYEFINGHLTRGDEVAIISNATTHAVAPLAKHFRISHILATQLEVREGFFTGNYIEPLCFRHGKIFWAEKLIQELGATFERCTFYTDSITDLPLLEKVRFPRVVNPDSRLRAIAKRRGWPIQDFRRHK
jgi:putative phosphoserine phosphatase / 1-acylglycerol-3-phosphate O-acyltransferase